MDENHLEKGLCTMQDFRTRRLSGLALISNYLWGLPIGLMTLILNVPLVIVSYKVVGNSSC